MKCKHIFNHNKIIQQYKLNIFISLGLTLHQNAFSFILGFIRFWMNLDIFTMMKLINPLMNKNQLLRVMNQPFIY
jgi:hypothetical protein